MAFAKSLLTECDRDTDLSIDGFGAPFRLDRLAGVAWKTQGGGVCLYVSKPYSVTVRVTEYGLRPFWLSCLSNYL